MAATNNAFLSLPATILVATPPLVAHRHRAFAHHLGGQHKPEARGTRQAAKEARGVCKPRRGERKSGPHWCARYEAGESEARARSPCHRRPLSFYSIFRLPTTGSSASRCLGGVQRRIPASEFPGSFATRRMLFVSAVRGPIVLASESPGSRVPSSTGLRRVAHGPFFKLYPYHATRQHTKRAPRIFLHAAWGHSVSIFFLPLRGTQAFEVEYEKSTQFLRQRGTGSIFFAARPRSSLFPSRLRVCKPNARRTIFQAHELGTRGTGYFTELNAHSSLELVVFVLVLHAPELRGNPASR
ncbi:hypothetical protein C8J57DRAFT_1732976, partial [Mycena rebaudengoi]